MAARLKSASINQTLRLASKVVVGSILLYWMRSGGFDFGASAVFLIVFTIFYLRPALNNGRFAPSALILALIPFFSPILPRGTEALFVISWGISMFLLLGVKNLILIKRQKVYRIVHFGLVAALGSILIEKFGLGVQALIFTALFLIFREYYLTITESESERPTLIAALEAFIFIEIAWTLSFLSIDVLISTAFLTLFAFIFHDTTTHRLTDALTKPILIRNGSIFAVLTILISVLSAH